MTLARNRGALGTSALEDVQWPGPGSQSMGNGLVMKGLKALQFPDTQLVLDQAVEIFTGQRFRPTMGSRMMPNQFIQIVEVSCK